MNSRSEWWRWLRALIWCDHELIVDWRELKVKCLKCGWSSRGIK